MFQVNTLAEKDPMDVIRSRNANKSVRVFSFTFGEQEGQDTMNKIVRVSHYTCVQTASVRVWCAVWYGRYGMVWYGRGL